MLYWITIYPYSPLFIAGCLFFLIRVDGVTIPRAAGALLCLALAASHVVEDMPAFVQSAAMTKSTIVEARLAGLPM